MRFTALLLTLFILGCRDFVWGPLTYPPLEIVTTTLPDAVVGQFYVVRLIAKGGDRNYIWKLNTPLPDGLTLDPLSGVISGTPTTSTPAGVASLVMVTE